KQGLINCKDDDLVLISDLDEIVNLKKVLAVPGLTLPALIELPVSFYFLNLKSNYMFAVNLLSRYDFIKELNIGCRLPDYTQKVKNVIKYRDVGTGWHFSCLFGFDIERYQQKIKSFSHQEFNTPYYLNENRLHKCIKFGIDYFERGVIKFNFKKAKKELGELYPYVVKSDLLKYVYNPPFKEYLKLDSLYFIVTRKYIPRAKYKTQQFLLASLRPLWRIWKIIVHKRRNLDVSQ
ncbi:MAG: hypothetical protein JSS98_01385, partial [Bacteroidetes bacterium]|nr:hypothetical protein [Bacteroidota bacterium]